MADPALNSLLKWGIENSEASRAASAEDPNAITDRDPSRGLNAELLAQLMGGPSDADLMKESMAAIHSPDLSFDDKMVAWDNFEQLIENLDNANNIENLGLWMPLVEKLDDEMPEVRMMACWCIGTAVQNNIKSQERMLAVGALPKVVSLAVNDKDTSVRRKAIMALSSEIRNYQAALDVAREYLPQAYQTGEKIDAEDMEQVDQIIHRLRDAAQR